MQKNEAAPTSTPAAHRPDHARLSTVSQRARSEKAGSRKKWVLKPSRMLSKASGATLTRQGARIAASAQRPLRTRDSAKAEKTRRAAPRIALTIICSVTSQ